MKIAKTPRTGTHWLLNILLVLIMLVGTAAGVAAAPAAQPTPPADQGATDEAPALVEFRLPNVAAVDQLAALGADLAEYVRENEDGSVVVNAFVTPDQRALYESMGFVAGATIEDQSTWEAAKAQRAAAMAAEQAAKDAAEHPVAPVAPAAPRFGPQAMPPDLFDPGGEITVMRVDYFTNYAGSFLAVAARSSLGLPSGGPTMAMAWKEASGDYGTAATMSKYTDAGQYMYHRVLVRISAAGVNTPVPAMVRIASSTGASEEASVNSWMGGSLPPLADNYQKGFFTHYMDPIEENARLNSLAAEFPDLAELIILPYKTNGYQRQSMAIMNGTGNIGSTPNGSAAQSQAVALFARAMGQDGGNAVQAEFLNPGVADSPLSVSVSDKRITVNLGTDSTGALASTAAQVKDALNANPDASALVTARTWNNGTGAGIVQPRVLVNLSDFLNAPAAYPRGPQDMPLLRIGKHRDGSKVGAFLFCQQHAREWTTSLSCVETAERLLRNYAIDPETKEFVDNLDIFVLPNNNPDGALASYYDYNSQRKNLTNYCNPDGTTGAMPSSRNSWGVDINRNNSVGSFYDGYDGASSNCTSTTYAGPAEVSEPEMKNEHWVVDTYPNIKFANNIHSYGGYFMWAPGAYIVPGRITLPSPNIGIEAYFFAGADLVLGRIKEERGTVILPERTGPIADVLYSAAGNSADYMWYEKQIISYSFETGADIFTSTTDGTRQQGVGFQPDYATEGAAEAMEFASGNYGLFETALQYANDTTPPVANIVPDGAISQTPVRATFEYGNEPSVIYYTIDGSTPTTASDMWQAKGPRQPGQVFLFDESMSPLTLKWIGKDIKGNISDARTAVFYVDATPPSLAPTVSPNPVLLHGAATASPNAVDNNSGIASASCDPIDTSSVGLKSVTCTATDNAGNTASATAAYNVIYGFSSFGRPVDNPPAFNVANAGQAVPLVWQIVDAAGAPVTDLAGVNVTATTLACDLGTTPDLAVETSTGKSGLQNLGGGNYQFNWAVPKSYAKSCKTLKLDLAEGPGMERTALFRLVK
jgi:hypothetical protein